MIVESNLDKKVEGFVGIDPGATGAIAIMYGGRISEVFDMPLHSILISKKERKVVDFQALTKLLNPYIYRKFLFTVEMTPVFVVGGGSSSSANWSLGYSQGFLTSFFLGQAASFRFVRSQEWHKFYEYKQINYGPAEIMRIEAENAPAKDRKKLLGKAVAEKKRILKNFSHSEANKIAPHIQLIKPGKEYSTGRTTQDKLLDGRCEAILISNYGRCWHERKHQ